MKTTLPNEIGGIADGIAVPALNPVADESCERQGRHSLPSRSPSRQKRRRKFCCGINSRVARFLYQNLSRPTFCSNDCPVAKSKVSAKPSAADFVLNSFVVEQDGAQLRFIDADGSVYEGALLAGDAGTVRTPARLASGDKLDDTKKQKAAPSRSLNTPKAAALQTAENAQRIQGEAAGYQNSSFRVTGTNLSVNQKVVVNGNFILNTNATASNNTIAAGQPRSGGVQNFQNNLILLQTPNSRIYGNAIVGGGLRSRSTRQQSP